MKRRKKNGQKVHKNGNPLIPCSYADIDKNTIYMNGSKNPETFAHEFGHNYLSNTKSEKGLGKLSHKIYKYTGGGLAHSAFAPVAGIGAGIASGIDAAKKEKEGKKQNKLARHASWAAPLAIQAGGLTAEALASRKGYKTLKNLGASKEQLKRAKKSLGHAFGTYGTFAAINAGIGEGSRLGSKYITEKILEEESKKK